MRCCHEAGDRIVKSERLLQISTSQLFNVSRVQELRCSNKYMVYYKISVYVSKEERMVTISLLQIKSRVGNVSVIDILRKNVRVPFLALLIYNVRYGNCWDDLVWSSVNML